MASAPTVLLLGSPFRHASREAFLKKLTRVLAEAAGTVYVLGANEPYEGDGVRWDRLAVPEEARQPVRYLSLCNCQLRALRYARSVEFDYCIIRITPYLLPAAGLRLAGAPSGTIVTQRTPDPLDTVVSTLTLYASECLIVESESVLDEWPGEHAHKSVVGATYVDQSIFTVRTPFADRESVIGYLGLLRERKGVPVLMEAVPAILETEPDVRIRVGGAGNLSDHVTRTASEHERVEYLGYLPDEELVSFYNSLELFVLPTESEGLPNVALEAMACGTPVLATPVGGLPDLIADGENGFLMPDNSPDTIEQHVSRALGSDLAAVSERARETVRRNYTFEDAVARYERILGG